MGSDILLDGPAEALSLAVLDCFFCRLLAAMRRLLCWRGVCSGGACNGLRCFIKGAYIVALSIVVTEETTRTTVDGAKWSGYPIFRVHSLDNVVRICQAHWMDDIHRQGNKLLMVIEPDRDTREVQFFTNLGNFHETSHPSSICVYRFRREGMETGIENFDVIQYCMNIQ